MGRVVAALLKRIGITQSDLLVEVQRDPVAGYVGQTAPKTQEKIDEARAGVLLWMRRTGCRMLCGNQIVAARLRHC